MKKAVAFLVASFAAAGAASADLGGQMHYGGGPVTVEFRGETAGYDSELYYFPEYPSLANAQFLFHNHLNNIGDLAMLAIPGTVLPGDELVFGIVVLSDDNRTYFSGPAGRNPDDIVHNDVTTIDFANNIYDVGFEDLFGGGDFDYDDNNFRFYGAVPTPGALPVAAIGLIAAGRRRRK